MSAANALITSKNPLITLATHILGENGCDGQACLKFLVETRREKEAVAREAIQYALDNTFSSLVEETPSEASDVIAAAILVDNDISDDISKDINLDAPPAVVEETIDDFVGGISDTAPEPISTSTELIKVESNPAEILRTLNLLHRGVVELRVPATPQGVWSGYYDDFTALAEDATELGSRETTPAVYFTLQVLKPSIVGNNQIETGGTATPDSLIARYQWLPLDADPVRETKTSSTDAEKAAAMAVIQKILEFLSQRGIESILADSGNGGHSLLCIDLPAEDKPLVESLIRALSAVFSTPEIEIDTSVSNPSRIWKLYGTVSRKGENTPERPWRVSKLLDVPEGIQDRPINRDRLLSLLKELQSLAPTGTEPIKKPVDVSSTGAKILYGEHAYELNRIAGKLRGIGLEEEAIYTAIVEVCEKRCVNYGTDYLEMCRRIAHKICRKEIGKDDTVTFQGVPAGQSAGQIVGQAPASPELLNLIADLDADKKDIHDNWLLKFRGVSEMEEGDIVMVIDGVLQEGTCFIGANPGDGKTLIALAMAKAISGGTPLFGVPAFSVREARPVVYLIPESRDRAFRKRCESFRITTDKMKFMARTISAGAPLELGDPYLLEAVRQLKPVVFLDTASRFMKSNDENNAAQNRILVNDVTSLLAAGAVCVVILHHATKASKNEAMDLQNMLRGTSDLAAMCDSTFGIRKDESLHNNGAGPLEIEIKNLKDREMTGELTSLRLAASYMKPGVAFPVSYINETGNFQVMGEEQLNRTTDTLIRMIEQEPGIPSKELASRLRTSEYQVKKTLASRGYHRVAGGSGGGSPWHQDKGEPCPYAKLTEADVLQDVIKWLEVKLTTGPAGDPIQGLRESEVLSRADMVGFKEKHLKQAAKRLGVLIDRRTKIWNLPENEAREKTILVE